MSLDFSGYDFEAPGIHGIPQVGPWEVGKAIKRFFGVAGEYQLTGSAHSRSIVIPVHYTGLASLQALLADVTAVSEYQETIGTFTVDLGGGDSSSFDLCKFLGLELDEDPWKDGSGVNGWQVRGKLSFRQVRST